MGSAADPGPGSLGGRRDGTRRGASTTYCESRIRGHDRRYYQLDAPTIPDADYGRYGPRSCAPRSQSSTLT